MSSTANLMRRIPSVFAGASRSALTAVGLWNLISSSRPWPSGIRIIATSTRNLVEPYDSVRPPSLDCRLALQFHTKYDTERGTRLEVVDRDTDVVHPLDRRVLERNDPDGSKPWRVIVGPARLAALANPGSDTPTRRPPWPTYHHVLAGMQADAASTFQQLIEPKERRS
jgi:hypothetical protein